MMAQKLPAQSANRALPTFSSLPFALLSTPHRGCGVYIRRQAMFMEACLRGGRGWNNKGVNREKNWGMEGLVGTKRRDEEDWGVIQGDDTIRLRVSKSKNSLWLQALKMVKG